MIDIIKNSQGGIQKIQADTASIELAITSDRQSATLIINGEKFQLEGLVAVYDESFLYDPTFGDHRRCGCGHHYERHFDSYEQMAPVGCKYCACSQWHALSASAEELEEYKLEVQREKDIKNGEICANSVP